MKIKICGITNLEDALDAIEAGADYLGVNFYPASPRYISPDQSISLICWLQKYRPAVRMVGVFANASLEQIEETLLQCNLDLAQLSGDESPDTVARLGRRAFKVLRPVDEQTLQTLLEKTPPNVDPPVYLLDAYTAGQYGGTGCIANWNLAADLAKRHQILLAGGLTPLNVRDAIQQVRPWGVDVASGIEKYPGRKDSQKMAEFIRVVKAYS
jgi:phosphoribosylanthranilate isomerase